MAKPKVLIVDDDPGVLELVADALTISGHEIAKAVDGGQASVLMKKSKFDLVVSDVNMPKVNGFELLAWMRGRNDSTPIILLTARGEKGDVANGFRAGADDYLTKPFSIEELVLRAAAVLRRTHSSEEATLLRCGPVVIDEAKYQTKLNDEIIDLSPTEFRLLFELVLNKNKVLTKYALLDKVWGIDFSDSASVVDTYISYLRKKLHRNGFDGIKTVRGVGFQIVDSE